MSEFSDAIMFQKYSQTKPDGSKESWFDIVNRVVDNVMASVKNHVTHDQINALKQAIYDKKFIPGGRYLYAAGRPYHQTQNCLLLRADDSREGWSELLKKSSMALMTGAGIGVDYSNIRPEGKPIRKTGGFATGPIALMQMLNECGRGIMQGGSRRSAIWAGLNWRHADIGKFIRAKNWSKDIVRLKAEDFNFPAKLDMTNISVLLDDAFFNAYNHESNLLHPFATNMYSETCRQMCETGEPGFSIDTGINFKETLRNACTEITSEDDSDICNLGSINLANVHSVDEMQRLVQLGILFLIAGTLYSDVPYPQVDIIRQRNRRLGLGLMGLHEWLLRRGKVYGPDKDLELLMLEYAKSGEYANDITEEFDISSCVKTRAIAPNGTIGILAETTSGIEPIFCIAFKRRYLKGNTWHYQFVIDPTAKRLMDQGIKVTEDAYSIDVERRINFQAWIQTFVDHGISSTINLPAWGSEKNNESTLVDFQRTLMKYLPHLRGITCYPDGARGGQPLTVCDLNEAASNIGQVFVEAGNVCDISKGGSCGE